MNQKLGSFAALRMSVVGLAGGIFPRAWMLLRLHRMITEKLRLTSVVILSAAKDPSVSAFTAKNRAWVYILASRKNGTLYIGVTTDLRARLWQHRQGYFAGFTKLHRITALVHVEEFLAIRRAVARERALKGWRRARKVALIEEANPDWDDLAANWLREGLDPSLRSG